MLKREKIFCNKIKFWKAMILLLKKEKDKSIVISKIGFNVGFLLLRRMLLCFRGFQIKIVTEKLDI